MKRRFLSALLALVMVLTLLPATALAEETATSGTCGENVTWAFDQATGTLTISGTGATYDYDGQITLPWREYMQQIKTLVVKPGITEIGNCITSGTMKLSQVTLPEGLTRIGKAAFDLTLELHEIELPESLTQIGELAFSYGGLTHITIPANVKTIGQKAFWFCKSLTEIFFQGDAPEFLEHGVFLGVTATAYYPADNPTWTEEVREYCGGDITWKTYVPAGMNHNVIRISGADRIATSLKIADKVKTELGTEQFSSVIVASAMNFPDALTGSYLASVKNAPILLTNASSHATVADYIKRNLVSGGTVYILGGTGAVSEEFESQLEALGTACMRLSGSDRFATNLEILKEAGISSAQEILICTATGFADSLSASAAGLPILLVGKTLSQQQKDFLTTTSGKFIIIGGSAAVSSDVEAELAALGTVERVKGANRYETSVAVAKRFIPNADAVILAYAKNFPDGLCGGPLAVRMNASLILTDNTGYKPADNYVSAISSGVVVGGTRLISDQVVKVIFDLHEQAEIPAA